jgi:hypothetical protein
MANSIKMRFLVLGTGAICVLTGIGLNAANSKEDSFKYFFLFFGLSIVSLYFGLSWEKPSYGGGYVHKYSSICIGSLLGVYSSYLLVKSISI